MRIAYLFGFVALVGCAATPMRKTTEAEAVAAAKTLVQSMPWATQAKYIPQRKLDEWMVVVSCNACSNPDGSPLALEYVVRVDPRGKASVLAGVIN